MSCTASGPEATCCSPGHLADWAHQIRRAPSILITQQEISNEECTLCSSDHVSAHGHLEGAFVLRSHEKQAAQVLLELTGGI
jgi:hypothetical protein